MTCGYADRDGAYVLGSLSGVERLEFERHLGSCQECDRAVRRMAGLPGLLGRVDATVLDDADRLDPAAPVPDTLLPRVHRATRRAARRRLAGVAAAAAVVAAGLTVGVTVATGPEQAPPAPAATAPAALPMSPVGDVPVRADLALEPVTWGTRLDLDCTYRPAAYERLPKRMTYVLFVRTRDGRVEQVGTWRSLEGRRMRLTAATAASRADIASVEVRTPQGQAVLRLAG